MINIAVESLLKNIQTQKVSQQYFSDASQFLLSTFPKMKDWLKPWWNNFPKVDGYPAFYLNHCCGFQAPLDFSLEIPADETLIKEAAGRRVVALSMQGSKVSKQYPFHKTLAKYLKMSGFYVWSGFDGSVPMQTTLARLKATDLLITVPTSTQWLAKLVGCPSLMISGPLMPKILGAELTVNKTVNCQYCCQTSCPEQLNFACMAVPPQEVLFNVEDFFKDLPESLPEAEGTLIQLFLEKKYVELEADILPKLDQHPNWLNGWKILSDTQLIQGKDALTAAMNALRLNKKDAQEHCYVGLLLQKKGDLVGAEDAFQKAIQLKPDYAAAHNNLGIVKKDMGDVTAGIRHYRQALKIHPNYASCFSNLLFCLSQDEKCDAKMLLQESIKFAQQYEQQKNWLKHENHLSTQRPLKVGFVSADFRDHSVAYCVEPLLAVLTKSKNIEYVAYYNHSIKDATTARLKQLFSVWHHVSEMSDEALCQQIQTDEIDILVDLSGHTAGNRLTMFAMKPAPIQATWFGYLATTGLKAIDYYFADDYLAPQKLFDAQFTEKIIQLPVNANFLPPVSAPEVNTLPALENGAITFASFHRPSKISQSTITLWSQLLKAVPKATLLLGAMPQENSYHALLKAFADRGVLENRLQFVPRSDLNAYLAMHHQVDICLDTLPSSGITPTFYAAWMGVPTLCLEGKSVTSRGAMAIMSHLSVHAQSARTFIAKDHKHFVAQGQYWAQHLNELNMLRQALRGAFQQSAIAQPEVLAEGLEKTFYMMWETYCKHASHSKSVSKPSFPINSSL